MNYRIINDPIALNNFIEWLPNLEVSECYYVALFARKKYHPSAKNDKSNCTRFTATSKEWLLHKIKGLERSFGSYANKDGSVFHQDALALYININPRDMFKAQANLLKRLADTVTAGHKHMNPASLAMSEIQKAKGVTHYVDFDFDDVRYDNLMERVNRAIGTNDACTVLTTRGGFHLLVDPTKIATDCKSTWYNKIKILPGCDVCGDSLIPVPGCVQGNFTPILQRR